MRVSDFGRAVCITVDSRFPEWPGRARREVEGKGAECRLFLNGSARVGELGRHRYSQINGETPPSFDGRPGAYHLATAFVDVVRRADRDGVDRLLIVEDDLEFTADYDRVCAAVRVPGDWGLYYFGANHTWATTEDVSEHLLRVRGSYTTHCVGIHRRAFPAILALDVRRPIDVLLAGLHEGLPSYSAWPSVAVQRPGPSTIDVGYHADFRGWFASKGRNRAEEKKKMVTDRPAVNPAVRDEVLKCPHRGPEGGLVLLDEEKGCCGSGADRTECRAGKGARPGRVTLRECLTCSADRLANPDHRQPDHE